LSGVCVIAPHPDDEMLGAGGTLIKAVRTGVPVYWLIVTIMCKDQGFSPQQIESRIGEIQSVVAGVPFSDMANLNFPATALDQIPDRELIGALKEVLSRWKPHTVLIPWRFDAHTDHLKVHDCTLAATKSFRSPFVKTVLAMEILSETNSSRDNAFIPNWYSDISKEIDRKIDLFRIYESEIKEHPFPRSEDSIRALATLRGSEIGVPFAEAFHVIRHISD
jgi:LmbE family N-acetylglucosaminyl deacetylase